MTIREFCRELVVADRRRYVEADRDASLAHLIVQIEIESLKPKGGRALKPLKRYLPSAHRPQTVAEQKQTMLTIAEYFGMKVTTKRKRKGQANR
jgi:hypothetical protein